MMFNNVGMIVIFILMVLMAISDCDPSTVLLETIGKMYIATINVFADVTLRVIDGVLKTAYVIKIGKQKLSLITFFVSNQQKSTRHHNILQINYNFIIIATGKQANKKYNNSNSKILLEIHLSKTMHKLKETKVTYKKLVKLNQRKSKFNRREFKGV